jgi:hypothetical protein
MQSLQTLKALSGDELYIYYRYIAILSYIFVFVRVIYLVRIKKRRWAFLSSHVFSWIFRTFTYLPLFTIIVHHTSQKYGTVFPRLNVVISLLQTRDTTHCSWNTFVLASITQSAWRKFPSIW